MYNAADIILIDDNEEIFWITLSFFWHEFSKQEELIKMFIIHKDGELISNLAWCYMEYLPDYLNDELIDLSYELYNLFGLMMNYGFCQNKVDFPVKKIWSIQSLKNDDIWKTVRKMAHRIVTKWGIGLYPFDNKYKLDFRHMSER